MGLFTSATASAAQILLQKVTKAKLKPPIPLLLLRFIFKMSQNLLNILIRPVLVNQLQPSPHEARLEGCSSQLSFQNQQSLALAPKHILPVKALGQTRRDLGEGLLRFLCQL